MDYHVYGASLVTHNPDARTINAVIDGRQIWFKQPVPPKARIWHSLQKILAALCARPILRVTVSQGGAAALRAEAHRLKQFKALGFHVPDVLGIYDDMIIMTDAGPQLRAYLDKVKDYDARLELLKIAMREMGRLHRAGLAHGRPYMRDMTWDGEQIGFLDLEEDPLKVMPASTAQARDIWIFLSAASRYALKPGEKLVYEGSLVTELLNEYIAHADPAVFDELKSLVALVRPLRKFLDNKYFWKHIGRDARQSVFVNRCLEAYLK